MKKLSCLLVLCLSCLCAFAQTVLTGQVQQLANAEKLVGVTVMVKDKMIGTTTDLTGNFTLKTSLPLPLVLVFSMVGYEKQEIQVTNTQQLLVQLEEQAVLGQEVVVLASRVEENILQSPVSIDKLNPKQLAALPSADVYEGIAQFKGVNITTASLGFKTINMRGFGTNGNQRVVQLVDGIDNHAPGLGFPAGNLVGLSEIDIESIEVMQGAGAALYGANAFNGVVLMNSKNPFRYQGVTVFVKTGVNRISSNEGSPKLYIEGGTRFAKAYHNKLAVKLNVYAMNGYDWQATDYRDRITLKDLSYDQQPDKEAIHAYGDETNFSMSQAFSRLRAKGLLSKSDSNSIDPTINISRTGYKEGELTDYRTRNIKLNGALHYRLGNNLEAILQGNFGEGTSIYTGGNRFNFNNFQMYQVKAELKNNNFFVRTYFTQENAGNTYDLVTLGQLMNESYASTMQWGEDYTQSFVAQRQKGQTSLAAHTTARQFADRNRIQTGTDRFDKVKDSLTQVAVPNGAGFVDKTRLWQIEGMYQVVPLKNYVELLVGGHYRHYWLNSNGTLFADRNGRQIDIQEFGGYVQATKNLLKEQVKLIVSARYDKNQNFAGQFTPRLALLYQPINQHFIRLTYQTGFRIPTPQNQYIDIDVIRGRAIGGLPEFISSYNLVTNPSYTINSFANFLLNGDENKLAPYNFGEFKPEKVKSFEIGYKALVNNFLSIDAYYYRNFYTDFIKSIYLLQSKNGTKAGLLTNPQVYLIPVNDTRQVESQGAGINLSVALPKGFLVGANWSFDQLLTRFEANELSEFNTPPHKINLQLGNRKMWRQVGFQLHYTWQETYLWESVFATGQVAAFSRLDAQVSVGLPIYNGVFKIGASNLLNSYYTSAFGNPVVGGLYYMQLLVDVGL